MDRIYHEWKEGLYAKKKKKNSVTRKYAILIP